MSNVVPIRPLSSSGGDKPSRSVTAGAPIAADVLAVIWRSGDALRALIDRNYNIRWRVERLVTTRVLRELRECHAQCSERALAVDSVCVDAALYHLRVSINRLMSLDPNGADYDQVLAGLAGSMRGANQMDQVREWCLENDEDADIVADFFDE